MLPSAPQCKWCNQALRGDDNLLSLSAYAHLTSLASQEEPWETCAVSVHKDLAPVRAEYLLSPEQWVWESKDGAGPGCKGS